MNVHKIKGRRGKNNVSAPECGKKDEYFVSDIHERIEMKRLQERVWDKKIK